MPTIEPAAGIHPPLPPRAAAPRMDHWMLGGLLIGGLAVIAGIGLSGAGLIYFLQPSSALIVLGGTIGVTLVTSPKDSLRMVSKRIRELAARPISEREALIEEIVELSRLARRGSMLTIEPLIPKIKNE